MTLLLLLLDLSCPLNPWGILNFCWLVRLTDCFVVQDSRMGTYQPTHLPVGSYYHGVNDVQASIGCRDMLASSEFSFINLILILRQLLRWWSPGCGLVSVTVSTYAVTVEKPALSSQASCVLWGIVGQLMSLLAKAIGRMRQAWLK